MNPKTKWKLILDSIMTVLCLLLMNLDVTGIAVHEAIGAGIVTLFAVHLGINRRWIRSVAAHFGNPSSGRAKAMFLLDAGIAVAMTATVVSGFRISQVLFPALAARDISLWLIVHAAASWVTLLLLAAHVAFHWRWLLSLLRRLAPARSLRAVGAALSLMVIATTALYTLISASLVSQIVNGSGDDILAAGQTSQTATTTGNAAAPLLSASGTTGLTDGASLTGASGASTSASDLADAADQTLQQFLGKLYCTACGKHCPLTSPRCARGQSQAQKATADYNATLAFDMTTHMTLSL